MKFRFLLSVIGVFMVFLSAAQNCLKVTSAVFSNPSNDGQTWQLDIAFTASGNKTLEVYIYCNNVLIRQDCFQHNGNGTMQYTGLSCGTGLSTLKAEFVPRTGSCGSAQCGNSSVVIGGGPLPVAFENMNAVKKNNQLEVNWTTASENNCKEFVVEGSSDNVNWTAIGKLDSKAVNGTSSGPLDYSLVIGLPVAAAALGMGGLFLLTLARSRWARVLALVAIVVAAGACLKDNKAAALENGAVGFVRVAQHDKEGLVSYSKVIKVVND